MTHVSYNTGQVEWYTPGDIIETARGIMGGIDCDPASSDAANKVVKATQYWTAENDGLWPGNKWGERVWLNPPYSNRLISQFADRLMHEFWLGTVEKAIWLSNNATETAWGQLILRNAECVCFPTHRIRFLNEDLCPVGAPLQGQMIVGLGSIDSNAWRAGFGDLGVVFVRDGRENE